MQIQINSLAVLERFIGGDDKLSIDIRNNIVQNFAHKHLKPLLNSNITKKLFSDIENSVRDENRKAVEAEIGKFKKDGWSEYFVLSDKIRAQIESRARLKAASMVDEIIDDGVKAALKDHHEEYIREQINFRVDAKIAQEIKDGIEKRFKEFTSQI